MPRVIALSVFLLSSTVAVQAEALRCSAPNVVESLQAFARDQINSPPQEALAQFLPYGSISGDFLSRLRQYRFPQDTYELQLSEFVGKDADESERDCTAKLAISSPGMKSSGGRVSFRVSKTEDGILLFSAGDELNNQIELALNSYDEDNGVYAAIQAEAEKENAEKSASTQPKVPAWGTDPQDQPHVPTPSPSPQTHTDYGRSPPPEDAE